MELRGPYDDEPLLFPKAQNERQSEFTEEQLESIADLVSIAKSKGHKIIAVSENFDAYVPADQFVPPTQYDVEKYGSELTDETALILDSRITAWIYRSGDVVEIDSPFSEQNAIWYTCLPYCEDYLEAYYNNSFYETCEVSARGWVEDLKGTIIGRVYEYILTLDPNFTENAPFYWTQTWLERGLTFNQIKAFMSAGFIFPDDAMSILNKGITEDDLTVVLDVETGRTIGSKILHYEITEEDAIRLLGNPTDVLSKVMTNSEAAATWNVEESDLNRKLLWGKEFKRHEILGYVRRVSFHVWLLHEQAMIDIYGERRK